PDHAKKKFQTRHSFSDFSKIPIHQPAASARAPLQVCLAYASGYCASDSRLLIQLREEPAAGEAPVAFGSSQRDSTSLGGFGRRKAGKKTQFHQLGLDRLLDGQPGEGLVQGQQVVAGLHDCHGIVQLDALTVAAAANAVLAAGLLDEDAAHGLGSGGEEVAAAVP